MKAYSEDLRRKLVQALDRGLNKSETARLFGTSLSSVKRYAKMAGEGQPLKPGKAPGVSAQRSTIMAGGCWIVEALGVALSAVSPTHALGFFERCGNRRSVQFL